MFTGIVTDKGRITAVETRGDLRATIATSYDMSTVDLGASIACSGVCLTVVDKGSNENGGWFAVDVSGETQSRTAPGMWTMRRPLNLERPLRVGDERRQRHRSCRRAGEVIAPSLRRRTPAAYRHCRTPAALASYVAAKGSIALDGVSLTVNDVQPLPDGGAAFSVNIIPHTARETGLGDVKTGDRLNIEIDILARYLGRMLESRNVTM